MNNLVVGVGTGFTKVMELQGTGFRASSTAKELTLNLGYTLPRILPIPAGLKVTVDKSVLISVTGANKEAVGQFCADILKQRPVEPYKGKGVREQGQVVKLKVRICGPAFRRCSALLLLACGIGAAQCEPRMQAAADHHCCCRFAWLGIAGGQGGRRQEEVRRLEGEKIPTGSLLNFSLRPSRCDTISAVIAATICKLYAQEPTILFIVGRWAKPLDQQPAIQLPCALP